MKFILYIFNLLLCLSAWASIDINGISNSKSSSIAAGIGISGTKTNSDPDNPFDISNNIVSYSNSKLSSINANYSRSKSSTIKFKNSQQGNKMKFLRQYKNIILLPFLLIISFFVFRMIYTEVISECAPIRLFSKNSLRNSNHAELKAKCIKKLWKITITTLLCSILKEKRASVLRLLTNRQKSHII